MNDKESIMGSFSLPFLGLIAFCLSAHANLPDEIDIVSYKKQYQSDQAQSDQLRKQANQRLEVLNWRKAQIDNVSQQISDNYNQQNQTQTKLNNLSNQNISLESDIASWSQQALQYRQEQQALDFRQQDLDRELRLSENRSRNLQNQYNQVLRDYNNADGRARSALNQFNRSQSEVTNLKSRIVTHNNSISLNQQAIQSANQQIAQTQSQLQRSGQRLNKLEQDLKQDQMQLKNAQERLQKLRAQTPPPVAQIQQVEQRIGKLKLSIVENNKKLAHIRREVNSFQSQITNLQNTITVNQRALTQNHAALNRDQQALQSAQQNLQAANVQLRQSERERDQLLPRLQNLESRLNNAKQEVVLFERDLRLTIDELNKVTNYLNQTERYLANANQQLSNNRNLIARLESSLSELQQNAAKSEQVLADHQAELPGDQANYDNANQYASQAETQTESARLAYQKRQSLYNHYLDEAESLGSDQALPIGEQRGDEQGLIDGKAVGKSVGLRIGEEIAFIDGHYRGLVRGKLSGHDIGYEEGKADQSSYNEGYQQGIPLGHKKAESEAKNVVYPGSYKEQMKLLLSKKPSQIVDLPNSSQSLFSREANFNVSSSSEEELREINPTFLPEAKSLDNQVEVPADNDTEVSQEELKRAEMIASDVDGEVRQAKSRLTAYQSSDRNLSDPLLSYEIPTEIKLDLSNRDCLQVYKQVSDFIVACETQYKMSFKNAFLNQHKARFKEEFTPEYNLNRKLNFEAHKNDRFQAAKQSSYPRVYAEYRAKGASETQRRGLEDGTNDGYNDHMPKARELMAQKGKEDANSFIEDHGVARLRPRVEGKLTTDHPEGLVQGADVGLTVPLQNLGKKPTHARAIVAKITALTPNIHVQSSTVAIRSLPGDSAINLLNVGQLKIDDYSRGKEELRVKVELIYPGDDVTTEHKETILIEDITKEIQPKIEMNLDYQSTVHTQTSGNFTTHDIAIGLKALNANVPQGYTIKVKPIVGAEFIRFHSSEITTPVMKKGESRVEKLSYTFVKNSRTSVLYLKVIVEYQDKEISTSKATIYLR